MLATLVALAGCNSPTGTSTVEPQGRPATGAHEPASTPPEKKPPSASATPSETGPMPAPEAPPSPPAPPPVDPAAVPVIERLSRLLQVPTDTITVAQVAHADWPNACLGLAADGEICAQVITPGYAVSLIVNDQRFEYRTDESGRRIRLAFAPLEEIGEALLTWNDANSFSVLQIGTDRSKIGQRGRPLLAVPLPSAQRAQELVTFVSRYAPFKAHTPAGDIVLRGVGAETASASQCRQIAEWANVVAAETERVTPGSGVERALVWRRQGGIAGFCDELVVSRVGFATAWNCRESPGRAVATLSLTGAELKQFYDWLDTLGPSEWSHDDDATADAMSVSLVLEGQGTKTLSDLDREAMLAFAHQLVRRMLTDGKPAAP